MFPYHGAGVLIWNRDAMGQLWVLIGKRTRKPGIGMWSFPGGGWERSKEGYSWRNRFTPDYAKTASRETREEIGLHVQFASDVSPLWRIHLPGFHYEVFPWRLETRMIPEYNDEFSAMQWFQIERLPSGLVPFLYGQVMKLQKKVQAEL